MKQTLYYLQQALQEYENIGLDDSDHLKELFPESAQNELAPHFVEWDLGGFAIETDPMQLC